MVPDGLRPSSSWQIRFAFPYALQFAAYVGRDAGFSLTASAEDTMVVRQWRARWERWVTRRIETGREQHLGADPRVDTRFDPPDFEALRDVPEVQELFRNYWNPLHQEWTVAGGIKWQMAAELQQQLRRVQVDRLVRSCAGAAGLPAPPPFMFVVDFLLWPEDYLRAVSVGHLVLGRAYLREVQAEPLAERLREAIGNVYKEL